MWSFPPCCIEFLPSLLVTWEVKVSISTASKRQARTASKSALPSLSGTSGPAVQHKGLRLPGFMVAVLLTWSMNQVDNGKDLC